MQAPSEDDDVATRTKGSYTPPDPKAPLSARVRTSIITKLDAIMKIWRAQAEAEGKNPEEIDRSYVIDRVLATATDEELDLYGGLPETPEQFAAVIAQVKKSVSGRS